MTKEIFDARITSLGSIDFSKIGAAYAALKFAEDSYDVSVPAEVRPRLVQAFLRLRERLAEFREHSVSEKNTATHALNQIDATIASIEAQDDPNKKLNGLSDRGVVFMEDVAAEDVVGNPGWPHHFAHNEPGAAPGSHPPRPDRQPALGHLD